MSTDESVPVEIMPSMQLLAEAAQEQEKLPERDPKPEPEPELEAEADADEEDDRSSSLSELEDRAGTEGSDGSDGGSSAAEDEEEDGLDVDHDDEGDDEEHEDGPETQLRDTDETAREDDEEEDGNETEAETERLQESPEKKRPSRVVHLRAADALQPPTENMDQTSEISALSDSEPEDASNTASLVGSPKKRKRAEQESDDEDTTERSLKKVSRKLEDHVNGDDDDRDEHDQMDEDKEEDVSDEEHASSKDSTPEREVPPRSGEKEEDEVSVAEEAEAEGPDGEAEAAAKSEEDAAKKEAALQELRSIEKDFALLRDKLFAEKSKQLNEELDMLRSNPTSHSEFSLASAAVARRRDEQKQLAMTIFEHSLRNLQNVSLAERTMAHCQYMQEVRESREKALDQAGHEWYRIQRERRRAEDDENEKRYHYGKDRALQVAAQQAYNREVSILSGVQKYVGFPAAPQLDGVAESDKADDLKKMGISMRTIHSLPISAPISSFPRQNPRADETFLDKNPWANPAQVYGAQAVSASQHQQPQSAQQAAAGLFVTPAASRRQQVEPSTQNSTSTIAVSSVEQTPISALGQVGGAQRPLALGAEGASETPSRHPHSRPELSITDASPVNGNGSRNGATAGHGASNGISGLSVSKSTEDPSPRSSPLKAAQVQAVSAGSN